MIIHVSINGGEAQTLRFSKEQYNDQYRDVKDYWKYRDKKFQTDPKNETILDLIALNLRDLDVHRDQIKYKVVEN